MWLHKGEWCTLTRGYKLLKAHLRDDHPWTLIGKVTHIHQVDLQERAGQNGSGIGVKWK